MKFASNRAGLALSLGLGLLVAQGAQAGAAPPFCSNVTVGSGFCAAPTVVEAGASGKRRSNTFFTGINWNYSSKTPELVLGFRSVQTGVGLTSSGVQLDVILGLAKGLNFDRVKLSYVGGQRSFLGEVGLGYSLAQQAYLVGGGLQAGHLSAGVDYLLGGAVMPYLGVNTLDRAKAPNPSVGSASCSSGALTGSSGLTLDSAAIVNGQTCFTANSPL
jgi:hypothetical protein